MANNKCPRCGHGLFTQTIMRADLDILVDKPGKIFRIGNLECAVCGAHIFVKCKVLDVIMEVHAEDV